MLTLPRLHRLLPAALLLLPLAAAAQPGPAVHTLMQPWLSGALAGLALVLALLAAGDRGEHRLPLVAGACLAWSGLLLPFTGLDLGWQTLLALCLLILLLREAALRQHSVLIALGLPALVGLAAAWFAPAPLQALAQRWLPTLLGAELLLVAAVFLWRRWQSWLRQGLGSWRELAEQVEQTVLPLLVATAVGGLLLHADPHRPLPASIALLLLLLGAGLVWAQGRRRAEAQQRHRVAERHWQDRLAEQERQHQLLSDQRLEQVTERERKRIASDLHDDLGAKLLTIVHTSDNERISTLAREALEEMRLSVRGLTGRPVQLLDAIGDWRAEVVSRLAQSNIEAEWVSLAEEVEQPLPARAYVQTTRIIREAISNVIKHSGATRCVIRCALADGDFQLIIQDNGKGIPAEKEGRLDKGHGMSSMKSRAKQMQGQCLVESGAGWGTLIRLNIPL